MITTKIKWQNVVEKVHEGDLRTENLPDDAEDDYAAAPVIDDVPFVNISHTFHLRLSLNFI
jgi:hypothetical protein